MQFHVQIGPDCFTDCLTVGLQIEHILAFTHDGADQILVQDAAHTLFKVCNTVDIPDACDLIDHGYIVTDFDDTGAVATDRKAARQIGRRNIDGSVRAPFDRKFLGIDIEHFCSKASLKTEFKAL